ncbi:PepSY-associated TM helix domain-containing protein [Delftia sp. CH05]|uniref:PepSY-associated TM helix domain-containing protein n=1 Tax=Delftia sp. CH05 TaxID=2692194 RepID=UPI00135D24D2|nr:PepSY-associated TM helix domain-containing protein [Delftia sp. CH05]MXN27314.1 PepSY domain-containing protein [Delftia sp. CH05]
MNTNTTNTTDTTNTAGKSAKPGKAAKAPGIRQTMSDLHTWVGLLLGWFLYAMFLTGTVSYFRNEITQWMQPEQPHQSQASEPALVAQRIGDAMAHVAPQSPQWLINLPDARSTVATVFWSPPQTEKGARRRFENGRFDPATGTRLEGPVRETRGGEFFYRFHFQFHYMPVLWGRYLAGLCAMFMLVAIVSGVITHKKIFADFFTFRWGKGQRSWLDAHNALSVLGLPFHLMITYTGLVTLALMYMPWASLATTMTPEQRVVAGQQLSAFVPAGKPSGQAAPLAPLADMVLQAEQRWGAGQVERLNVNLPGDAKASVVVVRGDNGRVSISPQFMTFDGVSGQLLKAQDSVGAAAETRGVLYALHMGRFGDLPTRWLYFIVSLAGTAMVGTGLVLWNVKRRSKLPDPERPHFGFRLVERLNIATIAGLSIGMAGMLWANRLLPVEMAQRAEWEVHAMFIAWGATLFWAMGRPAKRAWIELLWAGAAALALLPVVNALTTDRGLLASLRAGDWVFAGMDLMLLALAALHAHLALRTQRHQPKAKPVRAARPAPKSAATTAAATAVAATAVAATAAAAAAETSA